MASEIEGNDSLNRLTPRGDVRAHIEYLLIQGRQFRRMPMVNGCTFWITSSHLDGDTCFMKMDGLSADFIPFSERHRSCTHPSSRCFPPRFQMEKGGRGGSEVPSCEFSLALLTTRRWKCLFNELWSKCFSIFIFISL